MTSQERDSVGEILESAETVIEKLDQLVNNSRRYGQVQGGFLTQELGQATLRILRRQHEALVLIESNLDERLRKIENQLDQEA